MKRFTAITCLVAVAGVGFLATGCSDPTSNLDSEDTAKAIKALRACSAERNEKVVEKVGNIVSHQDTMVAAEAVRSLGSMRATRAVQILKEVASGQNEKRGAVRLEAIVQLGRQDAGEVVLPVLRQAVMADPDPRVRAEACTSMARQRSLPDVALLVEVAEKETDPIVQARAVGSVERLIGLKFGYNPTDPPAERRKALVRMRSIAITAAAELQQWQQKREKGR